MFHGQGKSGNVRASNYSKALVEIDWWDIEKFKSKKEENLVCNNGQKALGDNISNRLWGSKSNVC